MMIDYKKFIAGNTAERLKELARGRKIVFWGACGEAIRVLNSELAGIRPVYFCDRNEPMQQAGFCGYAVKPPETLREEPEDSVVAVICGRPLVLAEVIRKLDGFNIKHCFSSFLLNPESRARYTDRFTGEYSFIDRQKGSSTLLTVLAGYKPFLWDAVFERIAAFLPEDTDVCLTLSGVDNDYLKDLAQKHGWSYLSTKENNTSKAQNIAIVLHSKAEMIFKLDEDIFIGKDYFARMEASYKQISSNALTPIGYLSPMLPINIYSYIPFLQKLGLEESYDSLIGEWAENNADGNRAAALHHLNAASEFMWDKSLPFDDIAEKVWRNKTAPVTCPYYFSIGAILYHRRLWEGMIGYDTGTGGALGNDEKHILTHCMESLLAGYIDTNILAGHFSYGFQTEHMRGFFEKNKRFFKYAGSEGS